MQQHTDKSTGYRFGGHQTFPLRQLWLRKAYHYACSRRAGEASSGLPDAMVAMGVGANMVGAVRFWARACGVIDTRGEVTDLAARILDEDRGLDPELQHPASAWLFHWRLASSSRGLTAVWYLFNVCNQSSFTRADVEEALHAWLVQAADTGSLRKLPPATTLRRDVDAAIRCYSPRTFARSCIGHHLREAGPEDSCDSLFGGLQLIRPRDASSYSFMRRAHPSLNPHLFAWCCLEFWQRISQRQQSLDFNRIAYEAGSPGRVFRLDELTLEHYLLQLAEVTGGRLAWQDQTGVRQVIFTPGSGTAAAADGLQELSHELLDQAYHGSRHSYAALRADFNRTPLLQIGQA